LQVVKHIVAQARVAVVLSTELTEVAILLRRVHSAATTTLTGIFVSSQLNHGCVFKLTTVSTLSVLFKTVRLRAETQVLSLTAELHHLLCNVLEDFFLTSLQLLEVVVLQALVLVEFSSAEFSGANLALDLHFRATASDVFSQLASGQSLELRLVTNVAAKF
jgi:hypothetical protein